jgi:hypothetical protein
LLYDRAFKALGLKGFWDWFMDTKVLMQSNVVSLQGGKGNDRNQRHDSVPFEHYRSGKFTARNAQGQPYHQDGPAAIGPSRFAGRASYDGAGADPA